ncbi:MAG: hypothetical protein KJ709_04360 [Nanoarchaeota archaeon]|nr:hypothetical protein [Nanoarchaeota archaeon]
MENPSVIQTGVDRLVELVRLKHRVAFNDAAKQLGVSKTTIEEWSNFLEEEGLVSIEYVFTTPYITERKMSKKEIKSKSKEFHGKKDAFVRKAESTLNSIELSTVGLEKMKEQFDGLKAGLSTEINKVKDELNELKHYEDLKKGIDDQMMEQRNDIHAKMDEINKNIRAEQKKYQDLVRKIHEETGRLEERRIEAIQHEEEESKIEDSISRLSDALRAIRGEVKEDRDAFKLTEKHINDLKKLSKKIEDDINKKDEVIPKLIAESDKHEKRILETQEKIMQKVSKGKADMEQSVSEGERVYKKFQEFFEHKRDIETLIAKISQDKFLLENEMREMIKKAIAFELSSKPGNMKTHITELQGKLDHIEKKKSFLAREIEKLSDLMVGPDDDEEFEKLVKYVRHSLVGMKSVETVREKLLNSGWDKKEVERAINKVRK